VRDVAEGEEDGRCSHEAVAHGAGSQIDGECNDDDSVGGGHFRDEAVQPTRVSM
jgi:hypothetical protein